MPSPVAPFLAQDAKQLPYSIVEWFRQIRALINAGGTGVLWTAIDFTGSKLTDILTRNHNDLQNKQGGTSGEFYHLTAAQDTAVAALGTISSQAASNVAITGGVIALTGRIQENQGAAVTAANNLVLGTDGNYFQISGATQINLIASTGWQGGSVVRLKFNSTPTVKTAQATSGANKQINLAGAADFVASALDVLTLVYDSTDSCWYEVSRSVN